MRNSLLIAAALSFVGIVSSAKVCTMSCIQAQCRQYKGIETRQQCTLEKCGCNEEMLYKIIDDYQTCMSTGVYQCQIQFNQADVRYFSCISGLAQNCIQAGVANLNLHSADLPCFDGTLSANECADLFAVALFGDANPSVVKMTHNRELFNVLLEKRADPLSLANGGQQTDEYIPQTQNQETIILKARKYQSYKPRYQSYGPTYYSPEQLIIPQKKVNITQEIDDILQKLDIKINFNETAFQNFLEDFQQLQMEYETLRKQQRIEAKKFIQDKYAETVAKVQMEWANVVRPVAEDYIEYLVAVAKDEVCDRTCYFNKCTRLSGSNLTNCLYDCGCNEMARQREFLQTVDSSKNKVTTYGKKVQDDFEKKDQEFHKKELQFINKYYDFLERQAVQAAGCEEACVKNCTNPQQTPLDKLGKCLSKCDCDGGIIELSEGDYDIQRISLYARDEQALEYFKKNNL